MFDRTSRDPVFKYTIIASCLEIYNETLIDMLSDTENQAFLDIWDDSDSGPFIPNLIKINIANINVVSMPITKVSRYACLSQIP
jgi:Kinesin motor domain